MADSETTGHPGTAGAEAPGGAHIHWDAQWRTEEGRTTWGTPEPRVVEVLARVAERGGRRALDLGCGVGRHTRVLAEAGLEAHGVDQSEAGLAHTAELARAEGVELLLRRSSFTELPYPADFFDYVLAWNVVYHGTEDDLREALAEVRRVLRPGGLYQSTMLSKRNGEYGKGTETSPNTFVQPGAADDKVHPHLYCDREDIVRLHQGFTLLDISETAQTRPDSYHWNLLFESGQGTRRGAYRREAVE